jgi:hypothetical protein
MSREGSTYATTDWARIVELYDLLRELAPSLVVDANRALAVAMQSGARTGVDELDAIPSARSSGATRTPSLRTQTRTPHWATPRTLAGISSRCSNISRRWRSKPLPRRKRPAFER